VETAERIQADNASYLVVDHGWQQLRGLVERLQCLQIELVVEVGLTLGEMAEGSFLEQVQFKFVVRGLVVGPDREDA